jgi:hypothetical protein
MNAAIKDATIKPQFNVVVLDETHHWSDEIRQYAGKMYGAYMYDVNRQVHVAELTPSYELYFLCNTPLNQVSDEMQEAIFEAGSGSGTDVMYVHCKDIDRLPDTHKYYGQPVDLGDDTYEEALEAALDHRRGNVVLDVPRGAPPRESDPALDFLGLPA